MLKKIISAAVGLAASFAVSLTVYASTSVTVKSGNYQNWIDRVSLPTYASNFYDTLEEGSDGDKTDDVLIDFTKAVKLSSGTYGILVDTVTGTASTKTSAQNTALSKYSAETEYIATVYYAFLMDNPQVFWLEHSMATSYSLSTEKSGSSYKYTMSVYFILKSASFTLRTSDYSSASAIYSDITKLNGYVDNIMSGISSGASDYAKVKYFNEYLTNNNEYNTSYASITTSGCPSAWQSISALKGTTGSKGPVCEGYSKAFKVLCDEAGIGCTLVSGTAYSSSSSGEHMWNYVKLSSKWYACDITWNDPLTSASKAKSGSETENYLLVGSTTVISGKTFSSTHTLTNIISDSLSISLTNGPSLQSKSYYDQNTPAAPTISSSFSSTADTATVSWSSVSGATGYRVSRYVSSTSSWKTVITISDSSVLSYTETGLSAGATYKYRVKAYKTINSTTFWSEASSTLTLTTLPTASSFNSTKGYTCTATAIRLNWNKVSGASGYRLYQYDSSSKKWVCIKTISGGSTLTYRIAGLSSGTTYKYKVKAYKRLNGTVYWGSASDSFSASTKPGKTTITTASKSRIAVRLNWNKVTGASGYKIQQKIDGVWTTIGTVRDGSTLTYRIEGLDSATAYYFRVRAYSKVDGKTLFGAYSAVKKATTLS